MPHDAASAFTLYVARDRRDASRHDLGSILCIRLVDRFVPGMVDIVECHGRHPGMPSWLVGTPTLHAATGEVWRGNQALERLQELAYAAEPPPPRRARRRAPRRTAARRRRRRRRAPRAPSPARSARPRRSGATTTTTTRRPPSFGASPTTARRTSRSAGASSRATTSRAR